jgi:hypothetical protein
VVPAQIFVSYARADNASPPDAPEAKGFVTFLQEQLQYEFQQLGQPVPRIWRDRRVDPGDQFEPLIEDALKDSSLLLVVLSRNWLTRPWCLRELDYFAQRWSKESDRTKRRRIVVAAKHHIDRGKLPPLLQGQAGYEFFALDEDRGLEQDFYGRGKILDSRYSDRIKELGNYLWRRAREQVDGSVSNNIALQNNTVQRLDPPYSDVNIEDVSQPSKLQTFLQHVKTFVIEDQIEESGGWPKSWMGVFHYNTGRHPSDEDRREGGIISMYLAIRSLAAANPGLTTHQMPGATAFRYLRDRQQKADGGIGRYVTSRTGAEIRPTFRHTALAVLSLVHMGAPTERIINGLNYLSKLSPQSLMEDSSRSIAIAATLLSLDVAVRSGWAEAHLPEKLRQRMSQVLDRYKETLLQLLESECKDPETGYAPLWVPYGRFKPMIYMSALTTIDLLTLYREPPWHLILEALHYLALQRKGAALPYDPSQDSPDIGMSSFFAMICYRPNVRAQLLALQDKDVLDAARDCLQFAIGAWDQSEFWKYVYVDTIANALLLRFKP